MADSCITTAYGSGMGARPQEKGVCFRGGAPHGTAEHVVGTFNGWNKKPAAPRSEEGNGYWFGHVPKAEVEDEYR